MRRPPRRQTWLPNIRSQTTGEEATMFRSLIPKSGRVRRRTLLAAALLPATLVAIPAP